MYVLENEKDLLKKLEKAVGFTLEKCATIRLLRPG